MSEAQAWTPPAVGTPCWIGIPAADVKACKKFYSGLFPSWTFKPATAEHTEDDIAMWTFAGDSGLTGGIVQTPAEGKAGAHEMGTGFTVYLFVESIEATVKRVKALGGTVVGEKHAEGNSGFYQIFKDVAGNKFGVYEVKM